MGTPHHSPVPSDRCLGILSSEGTMKTAHPVIIGIDTHKVSHVAVRLIRKVPAWQHFLFRPIRRDIWSWNVGRDMKRLLHTTRSSNALSPNARQT